MFQSPSHCDTVTFSEEQQKFALEILKELASNKNKVSIKKLFISWFETNCILTCILFIYQNY